MKKESQVQQHDQIPAVLLEPLLNVSLEIFSIDIVPELMRNANIRQSTGRFPVIHSSCGVVRSLCVNWYCSFNEPT